MNTKILVRLAMMLLVSAPTAEGSFLFNWIWRPWSRTGDTAVTSNPVGRAAAAPADQAVNAKKRKHEQVEGRDEVVERPTKQQTGSVFGWMNRDPATKQAQEDAKLAGNTMGTIQSLKSQIADLTKREEHLDRQVKEKAAMAVRLSKTGKAKQAKLVMGQRQLLLKQIESLENQRHNLEVSIANIEAAASNHQVLREMTQIRTNLNEFGKVIDPDTVSEVMDDIAEANDVLNEANEVLSKPAEVAGANDEELDADLQALMEADEQEQGQQNEDLEGITEEPVTANVPGRKVLRGKRTMVNPDVQMDRLNSIVVPKATTVPTTVDADLAALSDIMNG